MPVCGSKASKLPFVWANLEFFSANQKISCRDWWPWTNLVISPWPGDKATINGVAANRHTPSCPKKFRVQKSAGKFLASIVWDEDGILLLIIFQRAKLSTRSITHICWCKCRNVLRKNASGSSPRRSCSCTTIHRLTGYLQPRRNWPTLASSVLITHPILRIWLRRTTTCSLDWKKQLKGRYFSSKAGVIPATEAWLDGQTSEFFWMACRS